jgi:hypothetical protein
VLRIYGRKTTKERRKYWVYTFWKKFKKPEWGIEDLRSDIAFFHQLISMYYSHKEKLQRGGLIHICASSFDPEFLKAGINIVKIALFSKGKWTERFESARPFLKKEIYLIFKWMLGKRAVKSKDIDEAIKKLYARIAPKKRKEIMHFDRKGFEEHLKSFYR